MAETTKQKPSLSSSLNPSELIKKGKQNRTSGSLEAVQVGTQLLDNPEFQRVMPPDTQMELSDAVRRADEAYKDRANTNDWAEVAQTLGRAITQFGAAQAGMRSGRDMSNINFGPGIDYSARTERAFREASQQKKDAQDAAENRRRNWIDEQALKERDFTRQETAAERTARALREKEQDAMRASELSRTLAREDTSLQRQALRDTYGSLEGEVKGLSQAIQGAEGALSSIPVLQRAIQKAGSKDRPKLEMELAEQFRKVGIDPGQAEVIRQNPSNQKSGFLGFGSKPDEEKINTELMSLVKQGVDRLKAERNAARQRQESIYSQIVPPALQGKPAEGEPRVASPRQEPSKAPVEVKRATEKDVVDYASKYGLPLEKARAWMEKNGYVIQK